MDQFRKNAPLQTMAKENSKKPDSTVIPMHFAEETIRKINQSQCEPKDMEDLFKYLKVCLDSETLSYDQIYQINEVLENHSSRESKAEIKTKDEVNNDPNEKIMRRNLIHMGICFFIWNAQGNTKDPTMYGNFYRQKLREVNSKEGTK